MPSDSLVSAALAERERTRGAHAAAGKEQHLGFPAQHKEHYEIVMPLDARPGTQGGGSTLAPSPLIVRLGHSTSGSSYRLSADGSAGSGSLQDRYSPPSSSSRDEHGQGGGRSPTHRSEQQLGTVTVILLWVLVVAFVGAASIVLQVSARATLPLCLSVLLCLSVALPPWPARSLPVRRPRSPPLARSRHARKRGPAALCQALASQVPSAEGPMPGAEGAASAADSRPWRPCPSLARTPASLLRTRAQSALHAINHHSFAPPSSSSPIALQPSDAPRALQFNPSGIWAPSLRAVPLPLPRRNHSGPIGARELMPPSHLARAGSHEPAAGGGAGALADHSGGGRHQGQRHVASAYTLFDSAAEAIKATRSIGRIPLIFRLRELRSLDDESSLHHFRYRLRLLQQREAEAAVRQRT
jgi:hypothetical protein